MQTINELKHYTFQAMLENSIKRFGERPALSFVSGEPISYNEAGEQIKQLQQGLFGAFRDDDDHRFGKTDEPSTRHRFRSHRYSGLFS